jgi:peptide/nickel transport system substrate-binding protein
MKHLTKFTVAAGLLVGASSAALAVERGGVMTYGRYADSLFLDPVLQDANVDIWILSNLYDTLLLPTDDGKGVQPGLATDWKLADDGLSLTLTPRDGIVLRRVADHGGGCAVVAEAAPRRRSRHLGFLLGSVQDVVVDDPKTVTIKLKNPDPAIVPALTVFNTQIMQKKAFEAAPGATDEEKAKAYAEHPISLGLRRERGSADPR